MSDKSSLAADLKIRAVVLAQDRRWVEHSIATILVRVPSCGVVPVDQRERLKSERYGQ